MSHFFLPSLAGGEEKWVLALIKKSLENSRVSPEPLNTRFIKKDLFLSPDKLDSKMKFSITGYAHYRPSVIERTLESSLGSRGIPLGEPMEAVTWDSIDPAIAREIRIGDFRAIYGRHIRKELYLENTEEWIPFNDFIRYLNNPENFFEIIDLSEGDLALGMLFERERLTALRGMKKEDLAQAVNAFYALDVSPETFDLREEDMHTVLLSTLEGYGRPSSPENIIRMLVGYIIDEH